VGEVIKWVGQSGTVNAGVIVPIRAAECRSKQINGQVGVE
jgi:hypothetical protein